MTTTIAVVTRDLRVHDNPMLAAAARGADHIVPVFVRDERVGGRFATGRGRFLDECLADLDTSLRRIGGRLVVREGRPAEEIGRLAERTGASRLHISGDVSAFAKSRERGWRGRWAAASWWCTTTCTPSSCPGAVLPQDHDHFAVFGPYHRRWTAAGRRRVTPVPERIALPARIRLGAVPRRTGEGGETAARRRAAAWLDADVRDYEAQHDALAADRASRLSPYLHLGCVSPLELTRRAGARAARLPRADRRPRRRPRPVPRRPRPVVPRRLAGSTCRAAESTARIAEPAPGAGEPTPRIAEPARVRCASSAPFGAIGDAPQVDSTAPRVGSAGGVSGRVGRIGRAGAGATSRIVGAGVQNRRRDQPGSRRGGDRGRDLR